MTKKWITVITDKSKTNLIKTKDDIESDTLYISIPFAIKDKFKEELKSILGVNSLRDHFDGGTKSWKAPLNNKDEIVVSAITLFENHYKESEPEPKPKKKTVTKTKKEEPIPGPPQEMGVFDEEPYIDPEEVEEKGTVSDSDYENPPSTGTGLATIPQRSKGLRLGRSIDEIAEEWNEYQQLNQRLLTDKDYTETWKGKFKNKSAFRKYGRFYELSAEVIKTSDGKNFVRMDREDGSFTIEYNIKVFPANNPTFFRPGVGTCDGLEKCLWEERQYKKDGKWEVQEPCQPGCNWQKHWSKFEHDIKGTAFTRALSRAISDLVAAGETSAEEVI